MRRRNSVSSASGTLTVNGRIASLSTAFALRSIAGPVVTMVAMMRSVDRSGASTSPSWGPPQGLERCAQLRREERRFFPGGEVAALVDLVEVGEAGVDRLNPAARGSPDLAGERREADGNRDRRRSLGGIRRGQELSELPVPP